MKKSMDTLITTVFTSALVATVASAVINAWLDTRKSKHTTRFDALNAAVALEGYTLTCAEKLSNHDLALSSDGHIGSYLGSIPELPKLNVVAGFLRPQKASVANDLLVFPQEAEQADQNIAIWHEVAGVDEVHSAAVEQVAKNALKALKLSCEIREAFGLPSRELVFGSFNVKQSLQNSVRENLEE